MASLQVAVAQLVLCVLLAVTGTDGKPPSAIIGGAVAADNEFPYQVSLRLNGRHICGGSIIGSTTILTAAHCVEQGNRLVNQLIVVTSTNSLSFGGKRYSVKSITNHPLYAPGQTTSWRNDLSVIKLNTPIVFDSQARIVNLPTKNVAGGVRVVASGWGNHQYPNGPVPDNLRKLQMSLLTTDQCRRTNIGTIYESHLCAFANVGSGVCLGDSGGPLVSNGEIVGVTSWVIPCAKGYPDVFTRVYNYVSWIRQAAKN